MYLTWSKIVLETHETQTVIILNKVEDSQQQQHNQHSTFHSNLKLSQFKSVVDFLIRFQAVLKYKTYKYIFSLMDSILSNKLIIRNDLCHIKYFFWIRKSFGHFAF